MMRLKPREIKCPAQSRSVNHRAFQTSQGFWVRAHHYSIAHRSPPRSCNSPDEAGVFFSLSGGKAEIQSDEPKVKQLVKWAGWDSNPVLWGSKANCSFYLMTPPFSLKAWNIDCVHQTFLTSTHGKKSSWFKVCTPPHTHTDVCTYKTKTKGFF